MLFSPQQNAASSGAYFSGWMVSGYVAVGDARDTVEALYQQNYIGAGMNAIGFVPLVGDGGKTANSARKFVTHYPGKARELGAYVSRQILPYTPNNFVKVEIWDVLFDGAGSRLVKGDVVADDVLFVVNHNGNLAETLTVVKRGDGNVIWLEQGVTKVEAEALGKGGPSGWKHIKEKHFPDPAHNQFAQEFGDTYQDENKIRELIEIGVKNGQYLPAKRVYEYIEPVSGKKLHVAVGSNGYIVSAFPFTG